jgi:uncharacterized protein with GYD domain
VTIGEFPDDEIAAAAALANAMRGNVRTQTIWAFSAGEMQRIIQKLPRDGEA